MDTSSEEESSRDNEPQLNNSKVIASGDCGEKGDNVKWKLHEDGLLVIEGSGKMKDYPINRGAIGGGWGSSSNEMYTTPWKDYNERIKSVVVSEGVSYIGTCSFAGSNVESIKLPDSLESISFHFGVLDCLSTLRIPKGVKRIGIDGDRDIYGLFQNANLENIKVDEENEYFSSVDGVLYNKDKTILLSCPPKKSEVVIPYGVKTIGAYAFKGCEKISTIELPVSIVSIEAYAFANCTELTDINIPYGTQTIGEQAFERSTKITSIIIPSSVTSIGAAAFSDGLGPLETTDHERITIWCNSDSYAEKYAKEHHLKYEYIG